MNALLIMLIAAILLVGIVVIAGLCVLGYFLSRKNEEKKEKRYEE